MATAQTNLFRKRFLTPWNNISPGSSNPPHSPALNRKLFLKNCLEICRNAGKSHDNDEMRTDDAGCRLITGQNTGLEMHVCLAGVFSMDFPSKKVPPAQPNHRAGSTKGSSRKISSHVCDNLFFYRVALSTSATACAHTIEKPKTVFFFLSSDFPPHTVFLDTPKFLVQRHKLGCANVSCGKYFVDALPFSAETPMEHRGKGTVENCELIKCHSLFAKCVSTMSF